ncbi:MAG: hypothetical protein ABS81_12460 [Pseudonocardia sp. SCN 72-86]|nr:MAG: hypothetical protein ABS81_12460 [Pseudonocardia sp. SCN 72-86]
MSFLAPADRATLVRMLRVMFPHPAFPDGPYERTAEAVLGGDARSRAQVCQGLTDLDRFRDRPFVELDDAAALAVLRELDGTAFFGAVKAIALVAFYDDHEVWDLLGYEGPSVEKGGYINRGFDDLDWLPNPAVTYDGIDQYEETTA